MVSKDHKNHYNFNIIKFYWCFFFSFLQGKLSGQGLEHKLPTVALLAHYDSMGLAPVSEGGGLSLPPLFLSLSLLNSFSSLSLQTLSHGYDSNVSGVAAILELARLFSKYAILS